jgi:hypothetical protein
VNRACPEFEPLLIDLAAGDVPPADLARLEAHLAGCDACRAEAGVFGQALALAALPPPTPAEREAVARGAGEAIARHRRQHRHRRRRLGGLLAVAAGVAVAIGVPQLVRERSPVPPAPVAASAAAGDAAAMDWQVPDLDAVWAASAVADPDGALDGEPTPEPEMLFAEALEVNDAD